MQFPGTRRRFGTAALLAAVIGSAACSDILDVENPARIDQNELPDVLLVDVLVNSVLSGWQTFHSQTMRTSGVASDELVNGHNFFQWQDIDLRDFKSNDTQLALDYNRLHHIRFLADTTAVLIGTVVDGGNDDIRRARVLAYGGYAYLYLGEYMCESPLSVGATLYTPAQLSGMAIERFDEAIRTANAARAAGASAVRADSLVNLSRVGAARAALQVGDMATAIAYASQVPAGFEQWTAYRDNQTSERNQWQTYTTGANASVGVDAAFRGLDDPRVRHAATPRTGHNQLTQLWIPNRSMSFSGWSPEAAGNFTFELHTRMASGLEARYIVAEAGGMNDAELLAFVNERRAVGGQDAVDLAGAALMAELREQRRRDFFLSGHRFGDLRRWKEQGVGDFFPSGPHPNASWGNYRDGTCFPVPLTELIGNPNLS